MTAVPDPRFRDQLAEAVATALDAAYGYSSYRWPQQQDCPRIADALMPTIAAEVEARVQAAANQRAAEELRAAARSEDDPVSASRLYARAAALASPAPAPRAEEGR